MSLKFLAILCIYLQFLNINNVASLPSDNYIFPCYYVYEPATLKPESIPTDLCTHVIILGCVTQNSNDSLAKYAKKPYDCSIVLKKMASLKQINPNLKLIMSMATDIDVMHSIVKKNETIDAYTSSAIKLAIDFNFDGIDLDWEYPCGIDRFKFTHLLQSFREKITRSNKKCSDFKCGYRSWF
jgi:GH18 family chitinase